MGRQLTVGRDGSLRTTDGRFPIVMFGECIPDVGGWVGVVTFKTPGVTFSTRRGATLAKCMAVVRRDLLNLKAELTSEVRR